MGFPSTIDRAVSGELAEASQHNQVIDAAEYMKGRAFPVWPAEAFNPSRDVGNRVAIEQTSKITGAAFELQFPNEGTEQVAYLYFICPMDFVGDNDLNCMIHWSGDDSSESVRWQLGIRGWGHGETMSGTHTDSGTGTFSSGGSTSNLRVSEFAVSNPSLSAKDLVCISLHRFPTHTGDTLAATAFVFFCSIEVG